VSGCDFTDAWVSFVGGTYVTGGGDDFTYVDKFGATDMDQVTRLPNVVCPDSLRGPCNTMQRLLPRNGTPTPTIRPSPRPTVTPGGPTATATATPCST
jgi:hypothetical protein